MIPLSRLCTPRGLLAVIPIEGLAAKDQRRVEAKPSERGQLPFRSVLMTEDDEVLIAAVRERLAAPLRIKVALDDL